MYILFWTTRLRKKIFLIFYTGRQQAHPTKLKQKNTEKNNIYIKKSESFSAIKTKMFAKKKLKWMKNEELISILVLGIWLKIQLWVQIVVKIWILGFITNVTP